MKNYISAHIMTILKTLLLFFAPINGIIILVILSVLIDTGFGVWRAYKTGEDVSSKIFRHGLIPKMISYVVAIMLVYAADFFMINVITHSVISIDFLFTKVIGLVLLSIEVKSIDENFTAVKGYSFLKKIIDLVMKAKNIKKNLNELN
jgi:hypothetical protein